MCVCVYFLYKFACVDRSKSVAVGSDNMSGLLIDMTKHLCNLKYRVWEKMLDHIDYSEFLFLFEHFKS